MLMRPKKRSSNKRNRANDNAAAVRAYLESLPEPARAGLIKLLRTIAAVLPRAAQEGISYGIPAFKLNGRPVVWFAAFQNHSSFFPAATAIRVHAAALKSYRVSKGTIQFMHGKPPPAKLVAKLVRTRLMDLQMAKA
jgi:uncharacterized protein YdhG (YjbR/CyaY superfamily)